MSSRNVMIKENRIGKSSLDSLVFIYISSLGKGMDLFLFCVLSSSLSDILMKCLFTGMSQECHFYSQPWQRLIICQNNHFLLPKQLSINKLINWYIWFLSDLCILMFICLFWGYKYRFKNIIFYSFFFFFFFFFFFLSRFELYFIKVKVKKHSIYCLFKKIKFINDYSLFSL